MSYLEVENLIEKVAVGKTSMFTKVTITLLNEFDEKSKNPKDT